MSVRAVESAVFRLESENEELGDCVNDQIGSCSEVVNHHLRVFRRRSKFLVHFMNGCSVRKTFSIPREWGCPVAVCKTRFSCDLKGSFSICVAVGSFVYILLPNNDSVEIRIEEYVPGFQVSKVISLCPGLLVELVPKDSNDSGFVYVYLRRALDSPCIVDALDKCDSVVFADADVPLIVTHDDRHVKVWKTTFASNEANGSCLDGLSVKQPTLQMCLLHVAVKETSSAPGVSACIAHDMNGDLLLCLAFSCRLDAFKISLAKNRNLEGITFAHRLEDVVRVNPVMSCRREAMNLDLLIENSSGRLDLFVAQYRICEVIFSSRELTAPSLQPISCSLSCEGYRSLISRRQEGFTLVYQLHRTCFLAPLVTSCISAIFCVSPEPEFISAFVNFYRTVVVVLKEDRCDRKDEWSCFVDTLVSFLDNENATVISDEVSSSFSSPIPSLVEIHSRYSLLPSIECNLEQSVFRVSNNMKSSGRFEGRAFSSTLDALHFLYEDRKLNSVLQNDMWFLASANTAIAACMYYQCYIDYYRMDYGECIQLMTENTTISPKNACVSTVPSIFGHLADILRHQSSAKFLSSSAHNGGFLNSFRLTRAVEGLYRCLSENFDDFETRAQGVLKMMVDFRIGRLIFECLPFGVGMPIRDALWKCRQFPKQEWDVSSFLLLEREDCVAVEKNMCSSAIRFEFSLLRIQSLCVVDSQCLFSKDTNRMCLFSSSHSIPDVQNDGTEMFGFIFTLRFLEDRRVTEVRRMLQSTIPVSMVPNSKSSDSDLLNSAENGPLLSILLRKRFASPVGRGAFTLHTFVPEDPTKPLLIPEINLSGRLAGQKFAKISLPEGGSLDSDWGLFHNGVASGLKLVTQSSEMSRDSVQVLTRSWIVCHKPRDKLTMASHAGMLLALGLGGFLRSFRNTDVYQYLLPRHDVTSIGLLLGLAASYHGTVHEKLAKMLRIHVRAFNRTGFLLPEFHVPVEVQTAAVLSIGLLYERSKNTFVLEGLYEELTRCIRLGSTVDGRHGLSLASGIAIGLVCLGTGEPPSSTARKKFVDRLLCLANGVSNDVPDLHFAEEKGSTARKRTFELGTSLPDTNESEALRVQECGFVNIDVVSPGSLMALALMYIRTNNPSVANRITLAQNFYDLNRTRPYMVYLQVVTRALILWDSIEPSLEWVLGMLPPVAKLSARTEVSNFGLFELCVRKLTTEARAIFEARAFGITGSCTALALRFAGSCDETVISLVSQACLEFETALCADGEKSEAHERTLSTCISSCCLSLGIVCAGSGDLSVLKLLRRIRKRIGCILQTSRFGRYMAMDMAIGFLFLGGGCLSFSNNNFAVASLLCSIYPKFPNDVADNQCHLQAFRHLYVLATESSCVEARDVDTDLPCQVNLEVTSRGVHSLSLKTPFSMPHGRSRRNICVQGDRYLPRTVAFTNKVKSTQERKRGVVFVKRRPGCLSSLSDPRGTKGIATRSLFKPEMEQSNKKISHFLPALGADPEIFAYVRLLTCGTMGNISDGSLSGLCAQTRLTQMICDCLLGDKSDALRCYFDAECTASSTKKRNVVSPKVVCGMLAKLYLKMVYDVHESLIDVDDLTFLISD